MANEGFVFRSNGVMLPGDEAHFEMSTTQKRHHYLPQSYLREFARDEVIWVYDRSVNSVRAQMVGDTAVKRYFYAIEREDGSRDLTLESNLAEIDGQIPKIVSDLRNGSQFDETQRFELSYIIALLMNRGPDFHEMIDRVEGSLLKKTAQVLFRNEATVSELISNWKEEFPDSDHDPQDLLHPLQNGEVNVRIHRNRSIELMLKLAPELAAMISCLNTGILHAPKRSAFITTDRPLSIIPFLKGKSHPNWAGFGLLSDDAQKFFPISSDMAIVFCGPGENFCHIDVKQEFVKNTNQIVGAMTDRFLLGRDELLVEACSRRLKLNDRPKINRMELL